MVVNIHARALDTDVRTFVERLKKSFDDCLVSVSRAYPYKNSEEVSVYITVQDNA